MVTTESDRFRRLDLTTPTRIERSLGPNPNPELAGGLSILIHRTQGVLSRRSITTIFTTRRFPSAPKVERADMRTDSDGGIARKRTLVGNPLNDEQRSDDLSNPPSRQNNQPRITIVGKTANLSLSEHRVEYIHGHVVGSHRSNDQQRTHGIKRRRLDEHGGDGLV